MSVFRSIIILCSSLIIALLLVAAPGQAQGPTSAQKSAGSPPAFVSGEILVKFKPHVGAQNAQKSLQSQGLRPQEVSPYNDVIRVKVDAGREQETIAKLLARGDVEFAGYNHILEATFVPDDASYSSQWALPKINAPAAWEITTGSSEVIIGIVDSGLDTSHPEFSGRIVYPRDEVDDDYTPQDNCTHGTHVAGIAAAQGNNSTGVAGLAWNVKILPVRVMSYCSATEMDIYNGIHWAVDHGGKIINLSLGGGYSGSCESYYPTMSSAVQYALDQGVLVVAAAGNAGNSSILCPAAMNGVMAVGSTDANDARSWFSNYGPQLDIAAPGSSIYSTIPGGYGYKDGTSMATPYVTGLAALLWSLDPSLIRDQVRNIIETTADDLGAAGWDQYFGWGRINAWRALDSIVPHTSPAQLTLLADDQSGEVEGTIQIATSGSGIVTWTTTISPSVSWLNVTSPTDGQISAMSSPDYIALVANTSTITYTDTPTSTTVVVTGTTTSGTPILPQTTQVQLIYVSEPHRYYFPIMFKH